MIPAHKPVLFERALRGALTQEWPALEVLISDDSEGPEIESLVNFYQSDTRVHYSRHPAPSGITSNYRRLIELARGDWGLFLDDDDELYPGAIATLARLAATDPSVVLIHGGYDLCDLRTGERRRVCVGRETTVAPGRTFFLRFTDLPPMTVAVLFNLAAARAANVFSGQRNLKSGDWEAWLKIALHGAVAYRPEALGCHYRHEQGYSAIPSLGMDVANASFIDEAARHALECAAVSARELSRWRRRMRRWYFTWIFATYIPRRNPRELLLEFGRLLKSDPGLAIAIAGNPALTGALILSPCAPIHRAIRTMYRRARFGPTRAPHF